MKIRKNSALSRLVTIITTPIDARSLVKPALRMMLIAAAILVTSALSIFILGEALIFLNEKVVGESSFYRFHSDTSRTPVPPDVKLPGPHNFTPSVVPDPTDERSFHRYLVELYSPVILQKMGHQPGYDLPIFFDFDGNLDPRDNLANENKFRTQPVGVYGEVTAVTEDSYYLLYTMFRLKDYDHPVREVLTHLSYHDNDDEGFMIRIDKTTGKITHGEGWFHNHFFLVSKTGESRGDELLQGRIYTEDGTHPVIYAQSMGHGVRFAQSSDFLPVQKNTKILRYQGNRPRIQAAIDRQVKTDCTYELQGLDVWYHHASQNLETSTSNIIFEGRIDVGMTADGQLLKIGRYFAGIDENKNEWCRPKPPWSWDDAWDKLPVFIWHFFPSRAFESHFEETFSHRYAFNRPARETYGMTADELWRCIERYGKLETKIIPTKKWSDDLWRQGARPTHQEAWKALRLLFMQYVNRLFLGLG